MSDHRTTPSSRYLRRAFLAFLAFALSCFAGPRPPSVSPQGVLSPGNGEQAPRREGAFAVVFGSPQGDTSDPSEISLVFNRPMRPLELAGDETHPPVTIEPNMRGSFKWVGTSALLFSPEGHLPRATDFKVTVPRGTRSLDGEELGEAYELRFSTPEPAIVRSEPSEGDTHVKPDSKFDLRWNQPVAETEVARAVRLTAGDPARAVLFDVRRPDRNNPMLTQLVPRQPLPKDAAVSITVAADMRGVEGPRTPKSEQRVAFRTYAPLRIEEIVCSHESPHGKCAAGSEVELTLNNPVKAKDIKRALAVEPAVAFDWSSLESDENPVTWFTLPAKFAPNKNFAVRLRSTFLADKGAKVALRDVYGQALGQDWVGRLEIDDLWPTVEIGVSGTYLEASEKRDIPILAVNVREMQLATKALQPDDLLRFGRENEWGGPSFEQLVAVGARVVNAHPVAGKNVVAKSLVRGDQLLGAGGRGPIAVGVSYVRPSRDADDGRRTQTEIVQVSDLGITAKLSREGSLVWVTRLSTAAPVAGAPVEIKRPDGDTSGVLTTDADGFAAIPKEKFLPSPRDPGIVFVRSGNDWAYRRVIDKLYNSQYGGSEEEEAPIGMVFTERGIYRPGDQVRIKTIARKALPKGTATPAGETVKLVVKGPEGEPVAEETATLSAFGTASFDVKVPESAKIGGYGIAATIGESQNEWGDYRGTFEVAEYRPAEFKVGVEPVFAGPAKQNASSAYVRGDKGSWTVTGDFLFGAPMSKADVRYTITRGPAWFSPPLPDGFVVGDTPFAADLAEASPRANEISSGRAALDDKGRLALTAPLSMPGQVGPEHVTCEAEVTDISRQVLSSSSGTIVHPGEFYVGMKPGVDFFTKSGAQVEPQILAVEPDGKKRARVPVHVDLLLRSFGLARQAGTGGQLHTVVTATDKVMGTCEITTGDAPVSCQLVVPQAGYYVLHATAKDRRGNRVATSSTFYAMGQGSIGWGDHDDKHLELVADRASYQVGQTAHVLVKSPFEQATALVTLERAGVYEHRRVELAGPMPTVDVPITDDQRPNVFLSVLIIRGRTKALPESSTEVDVGAPTFRSGFVNLLVDAEARRLHVAVKPSKEKLLPGERVDVDVDVRDLNAGPVAAEVTLYAVDEGVLSLIGYQTPDPIPVFSAPRTLRVSTIESREALASLRTPSMFTGLAALGKGLEGGGGGQTVRRDFRQSVYFNPTLVTDAQGHAHASFALPDSLTTFRIMAVAVARDDRFGSADARVVTSKPLMARPAFPRVLRAGDAIDAGVVLTSKGLLATKVEVSAAAEGLTLTSAPSSSVDLESNGSREVRFAFKAERAGKAKVSFRVKGGGAADAVEITRDVLVPMVPEAVALYGDTTSAAGEKLGDLSAIREDTGGLTLSVSSTALVGLGGGLDQLIEYPYGCTEQLTSRLVPLLPLRNLANDFQLPLPPDVDAVVQKTVAKVLANQRSDGGFGLFADSPHSLPWVTTYALWGLGEAKRHGVSVPDSAMAQAKSYLDRELTGWDRDRMGAATAAFVVDVLAENGSPDPGWMNRLFEDRKQLPLFSEAMLLHAMAISKGDPKAIAELVRELEGHLRIDGPVARAAANAGDEYAPLMDSEARTTALVLRGLLAANPKHELAARVAKGLLDDRKGGTWRSTQETAFALLALDEYRRAQEASVPAFDARAFLGNTQLMKASFHGRSVKNEQQTVPAFRLVASGGSTLAFELDGTGRLFYEARLRYARKELPSHPLDRGFFVKKVMRAVKPEALAGLGETVPDAGSTTFSGGDMVVVDLVVVTPQPREFVVVDDPVPAGLEAVDTRLATTAGSLNVEPPKPDGDWQDEDDALAKGEAFLPSESRQEVRDDRVLFFVEHMAAGMYHYRYLARATTLGTFVLPPTRAEEMYIPESFGRTGALVVTVKGTP